MKHCDRCGITLRCTGARCPLCRGPLTGEDAEKDNAVYPVIPSLFKQNELFFKLMLLFSAAAGILSGAVNLLLPATGAWSLFVLLGLVCFWISFWIALRRRDNIPKDITSQVIIISLLSILWDGVTGWRGWALDYVFPILCVVAVISVGILSRLMRLPAADYVFCLAADILFGILPVVFYFTGILSETIPSVIYMAVSRIALVALLIFAGRDIRIEISKRFHL